NKTWGFSASIGSCNLFGFGVDTLTLSADSSSHRISASASLSSMLGLANLDLSGTIDYTTGNFTLVQSLTIGFDAQVVSVCGTELLTMSRVGGHFSFTVMVFAYGQIGTDDYNVHASLFLGFSLTANNGNVSASGSGAFACGVTFAGHSYDVSL